MANRYRLSPEAQHDLTEIRSYYLEHASASVARYVMGELTKAFQFLANTPGAGHKREDLTDEPVKFWSVFAYMIVYDPAAKPLGIARVAHGKQDLETIFRQHPPRA